MDTKKTKFIQALAILLFLAASAWAQTTEFAYQGKLNDAGSAANGTYQMEFKLFGSASGADQIGAALLKPGVSVTNGVFNVGLDFGAAAFDGTDRFLEVAVKRNAGDALTVLAPRQKINSAPYAVKSKSADEANNAAQLGGVAADEYVTTASAGNSFIQNQATTQAGANFNIAGNGIVGGKLGVGMDAGSLKFAVNGQAGIRPRGNDDSFIGFLSNVAGNAPTVSLSTSDGSKAEMRLQGSPQGSLFKLVTGIGFGSPDDGITIARLGYVGIGTNAAAPATRLALSGGPVWTSNGWTGSLSMGNGEAAGWQANASGQRFGIGQSTGGLYFFRTSSQFGATTSAANYDMVIADSGKVGVGTTTPQAKFHAAGGSSWFQGDSSPLPAAAGKGIIVGFGGEQGYIAAFDYGTFTPKNLLLNNAGGNVGIGVANPTQRLEVAGTTKTNVLQITGGSDLAENFEFSETVKPGTVVAIDPLNPGKLEPSRTAYNRRVAGVISGANDLAAGMLLPNVKEVQNSMPVALSGRVWVYCDAARQPIKPGDLLTSSATRGHAMKAVNYSKAQGAIIGKAMTELKSGRGLVLVIVTLQ